MPPASPAPPLLDVPRDVLLDALREIGEAWPQVLWVNDAATARQLYVNPAWAEVTGLPTETAYADPLAWSRFVHEDDLERVMEEYAAWAATGCGQPLQLQLRYRYADGSIRWVLCIACATHPEDDADQLIFGIAIDNTETETFIQEALQEAHSDSLTGLRNRRSFQEELGAALDERRGGRSALLLIGLDGFKSVNDLYGHTEGDRLLQRVADVIRSTVRASDVAFRLGGDEFAVIHRSTSDADAVTTAERIVEAIRGVESRDPAVTYDVAASCGIALLGYEAALTPDAAVQQADAALYAVKRSARGGAYVFPGPGHPGTSRMLDQPLWGRRLHEAFSRDHFRLHAQPIISLQDGSVTGFELLLRLPGTDESTDEILRNVSRLGRTRQLDRWVVEHAARAAAEHADHLDHRRLTINLSITSFADPEFATWVERTIAKVPGGRDRFIFEITERDPITDEFHTRATADRLRGLGVELMLDDFGTGYGSPELLRALPFSGLKLARSFVAASSTSMVDTMIARHSSDLARALRITSVAEGIETEEVAIAMRAIGMTHGQGFLFGEPAPLEAAFSDARPWRASSDRPGSSAR